MALWVLIGALSGAAYHKALEEVHKTVLVGLLG